MIKCEPSANRRQVIELHSRVLGEAFGQIICKGLQLSRIPCETSASLLFRLNPERAADVYQKIGPTFVDVC